MSAKAKQDLIVSLVIYIGAGILLAMTGSMLPDTALFPLYFSVLYTGINIVNAFMRSSGLKIHFLLSFFLFFYNRLYNLSI